MSHAPDQLDSPKGRRILALARAACADLPEVDEVVDGFGHHTFKVRKKSFLIAGMGNDGGHVSVKADHASQAILIARDGFERTPYIGQHGWVSLEDPLGHDAAELAALVEDAWRLAAPKSVVRGFDAAD